MYLKKKKSTVNPKPAFLFLASFIFLLSPAKIHSQGYPEIPELKSRNFLFAQYQEEIQLANMEIAAGRTPSINFYSYTCSQTDNLFALASRCSLIYDTLVTVNDIQDTDTDLTGKKIILPTISGLFIPQDPHSPIEVLLSREYSEYLNTSEVPVFILNGRSFYFLQGKKFSQAERAFFLNPGMVLPLEESVLTSSYGMRISPISGQWKFHHGIDMAAPLGSLVLNCKAGTVKTVVKGDPTYGNYVEIEHANGMTSLYAHMNEILVYSGQSVKTGQVVGKVGLTGLTTGPHLHFEIRINGESRDPQEFY